MTLVTVKHKGFGGNTMDASMLRDLALQITGIDTLLGSTTVIRRSALETAAATEKADGDAVLAS